MNAAVLHDCSAPTWLGDCLCGRSTGEYFARNGVDILRCRCGVGRRVPGESREEYEAQYTGAYHASKDRHAGCTPYAERYRHDRYIASIRWASYRTVLGARSVVRALDVGCANGAFVDYLVGFGVDAYGVDPDPAMARERVYTGTLAQVADVERFDLITMHDVLEHMVDPKAAVKRCASLLADSGLLIIDVPEVWGGDGDHHFKTEHLWYFTSASIASMFVANELLVAGFSYPIPGKLVAYGQSL